MMYSLSCHSLMTSTKEVKNFDPLFPPVWTFLISIDTPLDMVQDFSQKLQQWQQYFYVIVFFFANAYSIYSSHGKTEGKMKRCCPSWFSSMAIVTPVPPL